MSAKNGATRPAPQNEDRPQQPGGNAKPVHELRLGRIRAAVWLNETDNGSRYNVQISRLYKDKNDKWPGR